MIMLYDIEQTLTNAKLFNQLYPVCSIPDNHMIFQIFHLWSRFLMKTKLDV